MLKIVIGQSGTLTLGEGGDNLFLLSQLTLCSKVWAKVNTQIRSHEKFQFKDDTGVRMRVLKEGLRIKVNSQWIQIQSF